MRISERSTTLWPRSVTGAFHSALIDLDAAREDSQI